MITLRYFDAGSICSYFSTTYCVVGPLEAIHGNEQIKYNNSTTTLTVHDSLVQSPGLLGENNVKQYSYSGEVSQVIPQATGLPCASGIIGLQGFRAIPSYDTSGVLTGVQYYGLSTASERITECRLIVGCYGSDFPNTILYYDFIQYDLTRLVKIGYQYLASSEGKVYNSLQDLKVPYPDRFAPASMSDLTSMSSWFSRSRGGSALYKLGSYTSQAFSMNQALQLVSDTMYTHFEKVSATSRFRDYGDLAYKALCDGHQVKTNVLAFFLDLRHITDLIPKLKNLSNLKGLANEYLSANYGILPTVSDIEEICAAVRKRTHSVLAGDRDELNLRLYRAGYTDFIIGDDSLKREITHRIKIAVADVDDDILFRIIHTLDDIGSLPDFKTIWDLIPYSFVVDWFVDIGNLLDRVDSRLQLSTMDIRYVTMSYKCVDEFHLKASTVIPFNADFTKRYYHRWVSDQCPVPPLSPQATQDFSHWVEASALIVQRR